MTYAASSAKKLVAHRGACAYAPEHTLASYLLALEERADFVEQDLPVTKDGVLVSIHDLSLERTTNVASLFPDRFVLDKSGPEPVRRWLVNDFTLAEIKQLDAGAWFSPSFAGARVPTFQEAIDAVKGKAGLYPELKDPEFYRQRGIRPDILFADPFARRTTAGIRACGRRWRCSCTFTTWMQCLPIIPINSRGCSLPGVRSCFLQECPLLATSVKEDIPAKNKI